MTTGYKIIYAIIWPIFRVLWPCKIYGKENIVDGACIICANHSALIDPILIAFALGRKRMIHFMAKFELSTAPILGWILNKCGVFYVKRGESDIGAIRTAMKYLKNGERIMMFPEGTRVSSEDGGAAKRGAVSLASKLGVPIIPINIPRDKKPFRRIEIHIGEAYYIEKSGRDELEHRAAELMERINSLGGKTA